MKLTKTQKVLHHLQERSTGISPLEAIQLYNATRLSAIIFNLRKRGLNIITVMEDYTGLDGDTTTYARYHLIKEKENVD